MNKLRILQLSDLCIGSETENTITAITKWAEDTYDVYQNIDYLVICGNLVSQPNETNYRQAIKCVSDLANALLRRHEGLSWNARSSRVFIVPGQKDVSDEDGLFFKNFHKEFFSADSKIASDDPLELQYRHLKDLTFIGGCYWNDKDTDKSGKMLTKLVELAHRLKKQNDVKYLDLTPTVFVTSGNPVLCTKLTSSKDMKETIDSLEYILEKNFKIDLHLFGTDTARYVFPQPFGLDCISLGTGARDSSGVWPLNMNLIEIDNNPCEPKANRLCNIPAGTEKGLSVKSRAYRLFKGEIKWDIYEKRYINGKEFNQFGKSREQEPNKELIYNQWLEEFRVAADSNQVVILRGLPGSGKGRFLETLESLLSENQNRDSAWAGPQYHPIVRRLNIEDLENYDSASGVFKTLSERVRWVKGLFLDNISREIKKKKDREGKVLIVVKACMPIQDDFALEMILTELRKRLPDVGGVVLFVVPETNCSIEKKTPPFGSELDLKNLPKEEAAIFLDTYSCCIPFNRNFISTFTGGYAGFSHILLEGVKNKFHDMDGAQLLDDDSIDFLLMESLDSKVLKEESNLFVNSILGILPQPSPIAVEILKILQNKIQDCLKSHTGKPNEQQKEIRQIQEAFKTGSVNVPREELLKELSSALNTNPEKLKNDPILDRILERLSAYGVLKRSREDIYQLRLIAPFLNYKGLEISAQPVPPTHESEIPEVSASEIGDRRAEYLIIMAAQRERMDTMKRFRDFNVVKIKSDLKPGHYYYVAELPADPSTGHKTCRIVLVPLTGPGREAAVNNIERARQRWNPRFVICLAIGAGFPDKSVEIGDIIMAEEVIDYKLQKSTGSQPLIESKREYKTDNELIRAARKFNENNMEDRQNRLSEESQIGRRSSFHFGPIASGDKLKTYGDIYEELLKHNPVPMGIEVDTRGVAEAVCPPDSDTSFSMILGVSHIAGLDNSPSDPSDREEQVASLTSEYLLSLLEFISLEEPPYAKLKEYLLESHFVDRELRRGLVEELGFKPHEIPFLDARYGLAFASDLMGLLKNKGATSGLIKLCKVLEGFYEDHRKDDIRLIREKLEQRSARRSDKRADDIKEKL